MIKHVANCPNSKVNYLPTGGTTCIVCECDMTNPTIKPVKTGGWRCEHCNRSLPKTGYIWSHRYNAWNMRHESTSGYYCDYCADSRESGMDY